MVLFVGVIGLRFGDIQAPHESFGLLIALNLLFATLPALVIALLFARSFLVTGALGIAVFSCGALIWSAAGLSLLAAPFVPGSGFNFNAIVTIHNVTAWGASLCYLAGAALLQARHRALPHRELTLFVAYALTLTVAAFIVLTALKGWTPVFFVQGNGGTEERQFVLGATILTILLTLSLLQTGPSRSRTAFLDWFVLALLLLVIGYSGLMLQTNSGSVLGWVSRAAQSLGGIYMLAAAYAAFRDPRAPFEIQAQAQERAPHRYGIAIALVFTAAALRLVFLQVFETRVAFIEFYPAVMLAALYGGLLPGVLATILSAALADYFWMPPFRTFIVANPADWLALATFMITGTAISWIVERLQQAQSQLHKAEGERRAELERMVASRTAELSLAKTEAERVKEAERQKRQELEIVLKAIPAAVFIAEDAACTRITANRAGQEILRIAARANTPKAAPEREASPSFEIVYGGHVLEPNELPLQRAAATGCAIEAAEFELRFVEGKSKYLLGNALPLLDGNGEVRGAAGVFLDITERKRHEEHTEFLMREVNHRAKNMLAVVQSIARLTAATKPDDFILRFDDRIQALSASQDLLVRNEWKGVEIAALVQSQLGHFQDLIGTRIELKGTSFLISASAAQTIGMSLHELGTNAGKYGALSNGDGHLEIGWGLERARGDEEVFVMYWHEEGGPPVEPPARRGFGSTVIQRLARESLHADVDLDFAAAGLSWRLRCPASEVVEQRRFAG